MNYHIGRGFLCQTAGRCRRHRFHIPTCISQPLHCKIGIDRSTPMQHKRSSRPSRQKANHFSAAPMICQYDGGNNIVEFAPLLKNEEKALHSKAFSSFLLLITPVFDCANHIPAPLSFCILSLFSSSEECTYRSSVIVTDACPRISDSDLTSKPTSTARVANVCLNV